MKIYKVETPEQLNALSEALKDSARKQSAKNLVAVWNAQLRQKPAGAIPITVTLELGTGAELYRTHRDVRLCMGKLWVRPAREIARELKEL